MSACGRERLFVVITIEVLVLASKQLFTLLDFQSGKGLEPARSRHLVFIPKPLLPTQRSYSRTINK
jgi:hypothetical protein